MRIPSRFVFALASLTFAFIPAHAARLLVLCAAVLGAAAFYWVHVAPDILVGVVDAVRSPDKLAGWLMAVTTPLSGQVGLLVPHGLAEAHPAAQQDLVIAFGEVSRAEGPLSSGLMHVERLGVLPLSDAIAFIRVPGNLDWASNPNRWGVILLAALLALFARTILRVGAGAALAVGSTILTFVALHLNAREAFLPMPEPLFPSLILAGGIIGAVVGYKAALDDRNRFGERLSALLLAAPLQAMVSMSGLMPAPVSYLVFVAALLAPTAVPVAYAAFLLAWGLDLDRPEALGALVALLAVRFFFHGDAAHPLPETLEPRVTPRPDDRGQFDLDDLIDGRET